MPLDTIPNFWTYKDPINAKKAALIFTPIWGPTQTRSFGDGSAQHDWELSNDDSSHEDFLTIKAFWVAKYPGVQFYLYDVQLNETRVYEIDSDFSEHYNHQDSYAWSFRIKECHPFAVIVGPPSP
jgi:hypothetical protein